VDKTKHNPRYLTYHPTAIRIFWYFLDIFTSPTPPLSAAPRATAVWNFLYIFGV